MYETRLPVQASAEETGSLQWEGGVGDRHSFFVLNHPRPSQKNGYVSLRTFLHP
ncbi:hypothetical protein Syn8016DRAFT_0151 [Synechococcus sp. WH 8016]|nr:hypothetical protein Syn8016DRAFT_0151 [Synechococcus sp. WH 8016]